MSTFNNKFYRRSRALESLLCVGLDPVPEKMPAGYNKDTGVLEFLSDIIEATRESAVAYKPNLAFFEAMGPGGLKMFGDLVERIRSLAPEALIIADAKRGDIADTAEYYARAFFEIYKCDAVTLSPYMGPDTLEPFLKYKDKGVIVLCLTSNPGAQRFEMSGNPPLFEEVARDAQEWNRKYGNVWLVVGATKDPALVRRVRQLAPDVPFLVPGVGAQGGDMKSVIECAGSNILINASRSILYGAVERDQTAVSAKKNAEDLVAEMRKYTKF